MTIQTGINYQRFNAEPIGPFCLPCAEREEADAKWPTGNTDTGLGTLAHYADDGVFTCPICNQEVS